MACCEDAVHSGPCMKLVVMCTLLLSDADVFFTYASLYPYIKAEFWVGIGLIACFTFIYLLGTEMGNRQGKKFCKRLTQNIQAGLYTKHDGSTVALQDVQGKNEHDFRVYMTGIGLAKQFYSERAEFVRNVVKWKHSLPFLRLARFGWMADIPPGDFAGILNANALYSFSIGLSQLGASVYYLVNNLEESDTTIILFSISISCLSFVLSLFNVILAFPKVLNDLERERTTKDTRQRAMEDQAREHIDGLRAEMRKKIAALEGKAEHNQEILAIMREYAEKEKTFYKTAMEIAELRAEGSKPDVIGV